MATTRSAWGVSLFCDDARQEVGGKISLMGIYQTDMLFAPEVNFPVVIPKLAILVRYFEFKGELDEDLSIRLYFPAQPDPILIVDLTREMIKQAPVPYAKDEDSEAMYSVVWPIMLSPVTIMGEGPIKVRAHCGEKIIRLGRLMVRKATPQEQSIIFPNASPPPPSQSPPDVPAS